MNSQETTSSDQQKYKIVFLGDSSVGKTSIVDRIINGRFDSRKQETIAIDFLKKNIVHKNKMYKLMFWDTAGQEKYQSLISSYIRDANCVIFVYDVSNEKSFENCEKWLKILKENQNTEPSLILVGNKVDLVPRFVKTQKSFEWALKNKMIFCQTSAKNGYGIETILHEIVTGIDTLIKLKNQQNFDSDRMILQEKTLTLKKPQTYTIKGPQKLSCCSI